ncbi:MAG: GntR family transcriptional regulator [Acidimicrobiales bacterium]|jgi:GntR family transcriptional regulator
MAAVMALDSSDPLPLWAQLARELRRRLASGEFDERFPTEIELAGAFSVSRATVREAIRRLRGEGLLDARRGSGTFVVHRHLDAPILGTSGLAQAITAAGLAEASKVLRVEEAEAGETVARALGTGSHEVVQWVERLRYADDEPLALDLSAIALDAAQRRAFAGGDLTQGSLYALLEARCGLRITGGTEQLRAVACTPAERKMLRPGRGEGILEVERVAYAGDRPVEWRRSLVRGRGYVLGARWGMVPPGVRN